jgi:sulfatase maturation enzyme AslB (radical SAM superfamily)
MYNSNEFKKLRLDLVNGIQHEACKTCWQNEKTSGTSYRIDSNSMFGVDYEMEEDGYVEPNFDYIDLRFSNLCNFKCIMCVYGASSNHYGEEQKKLGLPKVLNCGDGVVDKIKPYIKNLKSIYFAGGEPLIMKEHFEMLDFLHKNNRNIDIKYTTNLSIIKYEFNDLVSMWKDFKNVTVQISLDGLYEKGESIRIGMSTDKIIENIKRLQEEKIDYTISYTIGSYNIFDIFEFVQQLKDLSLIYEESQLEFHNFVTSPLKYSLKNLDEEIKQNAIKYLNSGMRTIKNQYIQSQLVNLINFIKHD